MDRFTVRGGSKVEKLIGEMTGRIGDVFSREMNERELVSIALTGGYGKGEGGVVVREGREYPHNNLDFIVVVKPFLPGRLRTIESGIRKRAGEIAKEIGIGIDLSVVPAWKLRFSPPRIVWYDMRFGHRHVFGDRSFIPGLNHFSLDRIPDWDARDLLINRATLLLINRLILQESSPDEETRKLIYRHGMKAVVGYGDAILYFYNMYHWSYREKRMRMKELLKVPVKFKKIYDDAMEFRFRPEYPDLENMDLTRWNEHLISLLEPVHRTCEASRLNLDYLNWDAFLLHFFKNEPTFERVPEMLRRVRSTIQKRGWRVPAGTSLRFRLLPAKGKLAVVLPFLLYGLDRDLLRKIVPLGDDFTAIRRYLKLWSELGDTNFMSTVKKYGISLD